MSGADNAWEEGSMLPEPFFARYPAIDSDDPEEMALCAKTVHERYDLGFSLFTDEHAKKYPLLARSLASSAPARDVRIVWTTDAGSGHNWTQIQRHPVTITPGEDEETVRDEVFDRLCADMESTLRNGVASSTTLANGLPLHTCGGVRELLGRELKDTDEIRLRPLREPVWRITRWPEEVGGGVVGEWIVEFSLQAVPRAVVAA